MRLHYKNITEALKIERPNDKVVEVLSNKFAIVKPAFIGGGFGDSYVMGIGKGTTVFSLCHLQNVREQIRTVSEVQNVTKSFICYNFPENKRYGVYLLKTNDNRKYKQNYRKLEKCLV